MAVIGEFLAGSSIWVYLFIFFGKIVEVAIMTLRTVLINRGERIVGAILAVFEIAIWLVVAGSVLASIQSDFIKVIAYVAAFSIGIYIGSWLEEKLAFGLSSVQVIVSDLENAIGLIDTLRISGFAVTSMEVQGMESTHFMLMLAIKRKATGRVLEIIEKASPGAFITISDVKKQKGGYTHSLLPRFLPLRGLRRKKHL